ncbi:hypothetical protein TWF506_005287 [Arthrobotrys conoides]|uniref:Uncharacterized protein n=1 Tax=Arthrobotrys conoides TaxID=74498 RepID=A0AAN8S2V0_9PEZI
MTKASPEVKRRAKAKAKGKGKGKGKARPQPAETPTPTRMTPDSPNTRNIGTIESPTKHQPPTKQMEIDSQYPEPEPGVATCNLNTPPSEQTEADSQSHQPITLPPIPSEYLLPPPNREPVDYTGGILAPLVPANLKYLEDRAAAAAAEGRQQYDEKLPTAEIMHGMQVLGKAGSMGGRVEDAYRLWAKELAQTRPARPPQLDVGSQPGPG